MHSETGATILYAYLNPDNYLGLDDYEGDGSGVGSGITSGDGYGVGSGSGGRNGDGHGWHEYFLDHRNIYAMTISRDECYVF